MTKLYAATLASTALLALPVATPAFAQSEPITSGGRCSSGFYRGGSYAWQKPLGMNDRNMCYKKPANVPGKPESTFVPAATFGNVPKANALDRCPVGYWTSRNSATSCVSYYENRSPASRPKRGGACGANEVDEWGLYCTSKTTSLTRAQVEESAVSDVNRIYEDSAGQDARQGGEYENTPGLIGIFGRKGGGGSASASSSSNQQSASNDAPATNPNCTTTSSAGAAIGGALGGQMGAALGGMMGGMAKK